ncbi:hypothetical protein [Undibacterium danionis]|uniref:Uncharacterized protein n=1 Tax=Undibacterium danionis TaxID=1812100 RepID=A0ABV6IJ33_9BURK
MSTPTVSQEELEQARQALHIVEPLDQVSPLVLKTLTVVAHCWRGKVPASLWASSKPVAQRKQPRTITQPLQNDFKRRAAGDFE